MSDYEVIDPKELPAIKALGRAGRPKDPNSMVSRLERGEVLWVPTANISGTVNGRRSDLKRRGFRMSYRAATRAGVGGAYIWAEKVEP